MEEDHPGTPSKEVVNAVEDMSVDPVETSPPSSSSPSSKTPSALSSQPTPYSVIWKHLDDTRGYASDKSAGQFHPTVGKEYCTPGGRGRGCFVRKLNFGNNSNIWLFSHKSNLEYVNLLEESLLLAW
jgi:hypothetical protein